MIPKTNTKIALLWDNRPKLYGNPNKYTPRMKEVTVLRRVKRPMQLNPSVTSRGPE